MENSDEPIVVSKFSLNEQEIYTYILLGDLNVMVFGIVESLDEAIELNRDVIQQALEYLIKRHPLLRAHLEFDSKNGSISFRVNPSIQTNEDDIVLEHLDSRDELRSKLESFNCTKFDCESKCKLWKVCALSFNEENRLKYAIGFVGPLFISDGLNGQTVIIEFTNIINSLINKTECIEMNTKLDLVESLQEFAIKLNHLNETNVARIQQLNSEPRVDFRISSKFQCLNEKGFDLKFFKIDSQTTRKIITKSKANNVKLNGYLSALVFYSFYDLYRENNLHFPKDVSFTSLFNLRFRLQPNVDLSHMRYFCTYSYIPLFYPDFGMFQDIWKDSRYIDQKVAERSELSDGSVFSKLCNDEVVNHEKPNETDSIDLDVLHKSIWCDSWSDIVISNLGRYVYDLKKPNPDRPFQIKEMYASDCLQCKSPLDFLIIHFCYWNDELMVLISSNKSGIGSPFLKRLNELIHENISKSI